MLEKGLSLTKEGLCLYLEGYEYFYLKVVDSSAVYYNKINFGKGRLALEVGLDREDYEEAGLKAEEGYYNFMLKEIEPNEVI